MGGGISAVTRAVVLLGALALAGLASAAGPTPGGRPVVLRGCDPLYYERVGMPQRLIVSDLPMEDSAHTAMRQMTQAIKLTLKGRGFRADRFSVGYVACDDSGGTGGWSAARCAQNARLEARHPHVVGVIGTLDSGCARAALPGLRRGGLLLVSPLNTADDLTGRSAKVARLSATDSAQSAAAARFLEGAGARRVAALSDGTLRGELFRSAFARAAAQIGLRVVDGHADAAYVGGLLAGPTQRTLVAARRLAGAGPLALSSGYGPAAQLVDTAGPAADGAYLFVPGVPVERLGPSGRAFVRRYEESIGTSPHPYAVYAAQAAQLLLDAIAGSNGSRAAVAEAVLRSRVEAGVIGSFAFDRNGDARPAPVTIFRVHGRSAEIVRVVNSGIP
jgi:branched-chain amino acid transport system substrate-binding protein